MSKKSQAQRQKRKNKKLNRTPAQRRTTLADPKVRLSSLKSIVREFPSDLKSIIVSRTGLVEKVTFMLLAEPQQRFDGSVQDWPVATFDGVAVLMAPGVSDKVAITSLTLAVAPGATSAPPALPPSAGTAN